MKATEHQNDLLQAALDILRQATSGSPFASRADLARATGVSQANLSRWLSGVATPTLRTLEPILNALGVRFAVGASHWRVDLPHARKLPLDRDAIIREWYRQQLWLSCDDRVTILGHPWYIGEGLWYDDFSVIPRSMNQEIAAAVKQHGKYVECSEGMLCAPEASERFRHQYAEFLRELFEMGIPVTYGSDAHLAYPPDHLQAEKYLLPAGFTDGDIVELTEKDFWI